MRRFVGLVGVGLLTATALGACTGNTIDEGQKAVIAQANEICLDTQDVVGRTLGDDPAVERDAIRAATEKLMAIKVGNVDLPAWTLFVQSTNNIWIALDDIYQSQLPEVNDKGRVQRAQVTLAAMNTQAAKNAKGYHITECASGYGRAARS